MALCVTYITKIDPVAPPLLTDAAFITQSLKHLVSGQPPSRVYCGLCPINWNQGPETNRSHCEDWKKLTFDWLGEYSLSTFICLDTTVTWSSSGSLKFRTSHTSYYVNFRGTWIIGIEYQLPHYPLVVAKRGAHLPGQAGSVVHAGDLHDCHLEVR